MLDYIKKVFSPKRKIIKKTQKYTLPEGKLIGSIINVKEIEKQNLWQEKFKDLLDKLPSDSDTVLQRKYSKAIKKAVALGLSEHTFAYTGDLDLVEETFLEVNRVNTLLKRDGYKTHVIYSENGPSFLFTLRVVFS